MFQDKSFETVGFSSTVAAETEKKSNTTQTVEIEKVNREFQKLSHRSSETQTSTVETQTPIVDYDKLANFLKKVTPGILEALDETYLDNVISNDPSPVQKPQAKLITKFSALSNEKSHVNQKINAVKWSTNGGTLAIAYSSLSHESWCDHLSQIKFYEFTIHDEIREDSHKTFETSSCVACLAYHPTEPSILSAGFFSGDVVLWNLALDNSESPLNVYTHDDTVGSLTWRPRTSTEPTLLVTSSSDGFIIFNKLSVNFTSIEIHRRYKIMKEHNPIEKSRPRSAGSRSERAAEMGLYITCLDFSPKDSAIFIVGTLCGGLYKCSTETNIPIDGDDSLIDPVIDQYERSTGSVICVKCSPNSNTFISSDTNEEIRVFNLEESSCLRVINLEYTVTGLHWIHAITNREIILAHGAGSTIKFYNISDDTEHPQLKIESSLVNSGYLDRNKRRDFLAIADTSNTVEIWKIPKILE